MPFGLVKAVHKHQSGSELDTALTAGATQLSVVDPDGFDQDGGSLIIGSETFTYTVPTEGSHALNLGAAVVGSYAVGEFVLFASPFSTQRYALVQFPGQEETLEALIPHALYDKLDTGIRAEGSEELVRVEQVGEELEVQDVEGKAPNVDGQFLNDDSVAGAALVDADLAADKLSTSTQEQVGISGGGIARRGSELISTAESTSSPGPTDLATVGPSVTVTLPSNGFLMFYAEVDMHTSGGGTASVYFVEVGSAIPVATLMRTASTSYETRAFSPVGIAGIIVGTSVGTTPQLGAPFVARLAAGTYTFRLQYGESATTATFRNRRLWAWTWGV